MCLVLYKPKNIPQGRPLPPEILAQSDLPTPEGTIAQLSGYIFPTKAYIDNWKKLVIQQYLLHLSSQYGKLWPTNG